MAPRRRKSAAHGEPPVDAELDRRLMAAAFRLGRRNLGRTWPNPAVGALIVRMEPDGPIVVGRGATAVGGRPHAETVALAEASDAARGATAYVTLEPCSHDGRTPLEVKSRRWQEQHEELWNLLVPSSGHAATVQGEVIRISGRLSREILDDGAGNWDDPFRAMARALVAHVQTGAPLAGNELDEVRRIVEGLPDRCAPRRRRGATVAKCLDFLRQGGVQRLAIIVRTGARRLENEIERSLQQGVGRDLRTFGGEAAEHDGACAASAPRWRVRSRAPRRSARPRRARALLRMRL